MMSSHKSGIPSVDNAAVRPGIGNAEETSIAIRLWAGEPEAKPVAAGWQTQNAAVYMIADLVAATHGAEAGGLSANFKTAAQALQTAKRILCSVNAFAIRRPSTCSGAAVVLSPDSDAASLGPANRLAQQLLDQARPGQILILERTCKQIVDLPSVQLRPQMVAGRADSESAAYELVWSDPDAITSSIPAADPSTDGPALSVVGTLREPRFAMRLGIFAGLPLLILMAVVVRFVTSKPKTAVRVGVVASLHPVVIPVSPPAEKAPEKLAEKPKIATVLKTSTESVSLKPPHSAHTNKPTAKAKAEVGDGFSFAEIPALLKRADQAAGSGDYSEARREYNVVLRMDPGNLRAKTGLHKIELSENETNDRP